MRRPLAAAISPKPFDQRQRALAVSLHREAKTVPAFESGIGKQRLEEGKAEFELVLFLGIDGERKPSLAHGER